MKYDVFICHASEDKESLARPLARLLRKRGISVWFDEDILVLGAKLRREIDFGVRNSRFGVVILSEAFFLKEWAQRELDGLFQREAMEILPILHGVTHLQVKRFSPMLADLVAVRSSDGLRHICDAIDRRVHSLVGPNSKLEFQGLDIGSIASLNLLEEPWVQSSPWLVWTKRDYGPLTWFQARQQAGELVVNGKSGWRLPTLEELEELSRSPRLSEIQMRYDKLDYRSGCIWSSTVCQPGVDGVEVIESGWELRTIRDREVTKFAWYYNFLEYRRCTASKGGATYRALYVRDTAS